MSNLVVQQASKLAGLFNIPESGELVNVLKATAFKGQVSDAQMSALLIVANQYRLNPWTKEIYAFPDQNNGIVPVVGVDGWARIINENPQFDGMEFQQDDESCTCIIYRKDRSHAIKTTEYLSECKRGTKPWQSHPKRMLRHKAMIQCARLAFGYVGIYDQDEAERIVDVNERPASRGAAAVAEQAMTVEFTEADQQLLDQLGAVADYGLAALEEAWSKITKEQRRALAPHLPELKKRAENVIEGAIND
ncbi:phage recombination protein Bet [Pseudoduganella flava]|uniref:Phage recombination protein Bet n=1 Tax=Pseudoduganella flava TaxID=871742 RepID=A0A562PHB7_9BURK|nr:phage recombination protein Bet [Pseudoduganella flava]TWI43855.1 phage recombination protein Bet [Pseudoduganella flava]